MKRLGVHEHVLVRPVKGNKEWTKFKAKLDTGANWSRIGVRQAAKLKLGPIEDSQSIRTSGGGIELRLVVPAKVRIARHQVIVHFTVSTKKSGVPIGRRTLRKRFIVDPAIKYLSFP